MPARIAQLQGMTLLEVLVGLLLLSGLSVGILSALQTGHRAYATVLRSGRGISDVAITQRFLRRIIESAYPVGASTSRSTGRVGLEGTHETLTLSAPMPEASGAQGFYRYALTLVPRTDGTSDLVVIYGLDHEANWIGTDSAAQSGMEREVLLEHVRNVKWDYLVQLDPEAPPRWVEIWHKPALPRLVRMTVEFDPSDVRKWPEFLAAPRLSEGAQCVFDLISRACREGS